MRFFLFTYLTILFLFTLSSCSYKQEQVLFERKHATQDSVERINAVKVNNYRIKPQDILQIRNLQNSKNIIDLTPSTSASGTQQATSSIPETYQVEDDGTVALTGLGHVKVEGLTRLEAMQLIEGLFHKYFLKDPIIEIKIINLKVTVLGEIKAQGNYILTKDRTSLIDVIGEAGGFTDKADETNIKIIRGREATPQEIMINLEDLSALTDPRTILQNGDIIYVTQNKKAVRNDKIANFSTTVQPGLIILSSVLLIITLLRR